METSKATDVLKRFRAARADTDKRYYFCFLRNLGQLGCLERSDWDVVTQLFPRQRTGNPYEESGFVGWGEV